MADNNRSGQEFLVAIIKIEGNRKLSVLWNVKTSPSFFDH
jgi:hypothetical protein